MSISVAKTNPLTVQVGKTAAITDEFHLDVNDTAYPDTLITYTITTAPTKGALLKNGVPTSSFTQDDLNNDRISYQATTPSNFNLSDSFFFKASDPGGSQTATTAFQINITQAPDMPVALTAPGSLTVYAGLNASINKVVVLDDSRNGETYTVTITAVSGTLTAKGSGVSGSGTSTLTITNTYVALLDRLKTLDYLGAASGRDQLTVTVVDQYDQTTETKTVDVTVLPAGRFTSLDAFGTVNGTIAYGINNLGQSVGTASIPGGGFLYSGGTYTSVQENTPGPPGGDKTTVPQSINDSGVIAGYIDLGFFFGKSGFIYSNGSFSAPAPNTQYLEGINNAGQVVGFRHREGLHVLPNADYSGFIYENGVATPIGPNGTAPYGINNQGQIVGAFFENFTRPHGFIYQNGIFSLFDNPYGGETTARAISDDGIVVGYIENQSGSHGFAYNLASGQWTTIDVPGASATFVYGISGDQIVGAYRDALGNQHGFVADLPSPLPLVAGNIDEWILFNGKWEASAALGSHPAGYRVAAVDDFTHDGTSDILWQNVTTGAVDLWKMSNGGWAASVDLGTHPGSGWQLAGTGDFNADGTSDVLWFNPGTGQTDIWQLINGQWAASVSPGSHPLGYQVAGIADFNRDGTSDVLWFNPATRHVDEWNIVNGQWAGSNSVGSYPDAAFQIAGVGDFNNDGTGDVLWYNPNTGVVDIWLLQNGKWAASVSPGKHPSAPQIAGIGDFNGDGTSDVLWYNPATRVTEEWLMSDARWAGSVDLGVHPGPATIAGVGDFNGSLMSDILWHQFA